MNRIFFIIITLSFSVFSSECTNKDDYIKYFFVNGVNVPKKAAQVSSQDLQIAFQLVTPITSLYNPTIYQGEFGLKAKELEEKLTTDLTEDEKKKIKNDILSLKIVDGVGTGYNLLGDVKNEVFPQKKIEVQTRVLIAQNKSSMDIAKYIEKTTSYPLVKSLLEPMANENPNIVFAHSQGNLVANEMCQSKKEKQMEIISIASPAAYFPCNKFTTYALFDNDLIIGLLRQTARFGMTKNQFVKPNISVPSKDTINHDLILYITDSTSQEKLASGLKETQEFMFDRDLKFDFLSLGMKENTKYVDENKVDESIKKAQKVSLSKRKVKSKQIGYQFGLILFDETYKIDMHKRSATQRNKEYVTAILDIPINARSDQEMKDFLVYMKKEIVSFCNDPRKPAMDKDFSYKLCDYLKGVSPERIKEDSDYEGMSLTAFSKENTKEIKLSCKDMTVGKYDIMLNYKPHSTMTQEMTLNVNGEETTVKAPNQPNTSQVSRFIAQASVEKDLDTNELTLKMSDIVTTISPSRELATVEDKESSIKSGEIDYRSCYTFRLLASSECDGYLSRLFGRE